MGPIFDQILLYFCIALVIIATFFRFLSDCLVPIDRPKRVASKTTLYCCLIPTFKTFNWLRSVRPKPKFRSQSTEMFWLKFRSAGRNTEIGKNDVLCGFFLLIFCNFLQFFLNCLGHC